MSSQQPDLTGLVLQWWGGSYSDYSWLSLVTDASNVVTGGNPPYGANEFFSYCPKFAGSPLQNVTADLTQDSDTIPINLTSPTGFTVGMYVSDAAKALPPATYVTAVNESSSPVVLTLSNVALQTAATDALTAYPTPVVPLPVLQMYLNLANACVRYDRWLDMWPLGMSLFIAHYSTLWVRSEAAPYSTPGQIAASGLAFGILTSKSAGDVSAGLTPLTGGLEEWGAWQLTSYGQQLATIAKIVGWGPMYEW